MVMFYQKDTLDYDVTISFRNLGSFEKFKFLISNYTNFGRERNYNF